MSSWFGAIFLVIGFIAIFQLLGMGKRAAIAISLARESLFDIGRHDISDEEKEKLLRSRALKLLGVFAYLVGGGVVATAVPILIVWGLDHLGLVSLAAVTELAISWEFILAIIIISLIAFWIIHARRKKRQLSTEFENRYSATSQALHYLAFATTPAQLALSDLEDRWASGKLNPRHAENPVFITSLPRAGTTLLLEMCVASGAFATHNYRHMPFLYTPILWRKFTRSLQTTEELRERAHGDGMLVNEDSPEALEEMLWLPYWKDNYCSDRIRVWPDSENEEFLSFFSKHIQKIVHLAQKKDGESPARYISKNNANISRIGWLRSAFPTAHILIPFRDPIQHAHSLLRQHLNFLSIHATDSFARNYMAAIGHFDFGTNLRPINFDGWLDHEPKLPATDINFWIRYWIAAYRHLSQQSRDHVALVDFDLLCRNPEDSLERIATFLELEDPTRLSRHHTRIHAKTPRQPDISQVNEALRVEADSLHQLLISRALFHECNLQGNVGT